MEFEKDSMCFCRPSECVGFVTEHWYGHEIGGHIC